MENYDLNETFNALKPDLGITETNVGQMIVYKKDTIVSQSLAIFGEYSFAEIVVMSRYLDQSSVYVDIGTNIGYHALAVNKFVGCNVIGFEPHPTHFAVAAHNIKDKNIMLYNAACSNKAGTFNMATFDAHEIGNFGEAHQADAGITVQCLKLDELKLDNCTVMKIDVEGHELNVMKGAVKTIKKFRPVIFFEALQENNWEDCRKFLADKDYQTYWVVCRVKPLHETFKKTDLNPFKDTASFNILAVPNEKTQPDDLINVTPGEWYHDMVERLKKYRLVL